MQLAVLPFQNVRKDERIEFLGFALADALISKLSFLDAVTVRPSSFVQKYRDAPPEDPKAVGRELGVGHLLTGSLLAQGEALRVSVQLVDLEAGAVAWQDTVDARLDDLLAVQDSVVARIVSGMKLNLSDEEEELLARDRPRDKKAFDLYMRAVAQPRTPEGNRIALEMVQAALAKDDTFAPAWHELAIRQYQSADGLTETYGQIEKNSLRALELNPDLAPAMQSLVVILTETDRHQEAYRKIKGWLARHPKAGPVHFALSYLFRYAGLLEEAAAEANLALSLEPRNPLFRSGGMVYLYMLDYDNARRFFNLDPDSLFSVRAFAIIEAFEGDSQGIVEHWDRLQSMSPPEERDEFTHGMKIALGGDREKARRLMEANLDQLPEDSESLYHIASSLAFAGSKEAAMGILERAVRNGFYCYPAYLKDPRLDPLRAEPRFDKILDEARKRHEAFKAFVAANP